MGLSPRDVDQLMLWEFLACYNGFNRANGGEEKIAAPSIEQHRENLKRLSAQS